MTQHTSRLCKGYLTRKDSDGVLHQITWPPQSPDLNPNDRIWDELECRVKEKQQTSPQLVERMPRVYKAVIKAKGEESNLFNTFLVTT